MLIYYVAWNGGSDGRDCSVIGRFRRLTDAQQAAKGRGTMGCGDGTIEEVKVFETYEEFAIETGNLTEELRKQKNNALNKLSPEERKLLKLPAPNG